MNRDTYWAPKALKVRWDAHSAATYYLNNITAGYNEHTKSYWIHDFCGTYRFYTSTGKVVLNDGVRARETSVVSWKEVETVAV